MNCGLRKISVRLLSALVFAVLAANVEPVFCADEAEKATTPTPLERLKKPVNSLLRFFRPSEGKDSASRRKSEAEA
ncbi:MAG: hypothetical protein HQL31_10495, partial [Planctomycetes bacterium]|nr:hypothetical protein [Planctomycetota bacterium]